jgi:hypothetical protein
MLTREQILEERKYYYSLTYVLFELVKNLAHKELCFLSQKGEIKKYPTRYLMSFNLEYFKKHFERFGVEKNLINLYHSCSVLKDLPIFSYNPKIRKEDYEYQNFNLNYKNFCVGYDFFIDIDGKENFELAYQEAKEIKKILDDEYKLPIYILNSSFTGFHICIQAKYLPDYPIDKLLEILNKVIYNFKGIYGFKTIDTSITDLKRVKKLPYSYVCDSSIALPLSNLQFSNFKQSDVTMKNVLQKIMIKNRGLLVRNLELGEETLKKNVKKFINDFQ